MLKKAGAVLKVVFGSLDLTQTTVLQILGNAATAIGALVPSESSQTQIIIVALGGVVSNIYPLVSAVHKLIEAVEAAVKSPSLASLPLSESVFSLDEAKIERVVEDILSKVENDMKLVPAELQQVEQLVDARVKQVIADLLGKSVSPAPPFHASVPSVAAVASTIGGQQA